MRINELDSHMVSLLEQWPDFFANPNYIRQGNVVTWPDRMRIDVESTPDLLRVLAEKRQFSLQVAADGSLVQLYYNFRGNGVLAEASLGFFYSGSERSSDLVNDQFSADALELEIGSVLPVGTDDGSKPSWLRIDYSPSAARDVLHYHCHMHAALSSDIRVPVRRIPTPKQFIEMIISWFYPETYRSHRLNEPDSFQISQADAQEFFAQTIQVDDGIPTLNGIHLSIP